ncbi:hypothetical protein [Paraburkholderia edwinii]|nr:hypothetical protein [Paraburkholderia edwinii]
MQPKITYTYGPDGRVVSAHVSGLVGKADVRNNTATKEKTK